MTRGYDAIPLGSGGMDSDHRSNRLEELKRIELNNRRRDRRVQDLWTSDADFRVLGSKAPMLSMTSSMISWGISMSPVWDCVWV